LAHSVYTPLWCAVQHLLPFLFSTTEVRISAQWPRRYRPRHCAVNRLSLFFHRVQYKVQPKIPTPVFVSNCKLPQYGTHGQRDRQADRQAATPNVPRG